MEVVIAIMLFGLLGLIAVSSTQLLQTGKQLANLAQSRDELVVLTRQTASDPHALGNSALQPGNKPFLNCLCGGGCTSGQLNDFTLFDAMEKAQSPTYYDASGLPCAPAAPNCLIELTTSFVAECMPSLPNINPTPPFTCATPAEFVEVVYTIQQNPATLAQGALIKTISGGAFTQVTDITQAPGQTICP